MADTMLSKKKEMNNNKENDKGVVSVSDKTTETSKSSSQRAPSSTGITQASKRKSPSVNFQQLVSDLTRHHTFSYCLFFRGKLGP